MYGMTREDWMNLIVAQDGKCLLCHKPFGPARNACVDHDHATGEVRGLLCGGCNQALGFHHENAAWFYEAWQYLTEPFARTVFKTPRRHRDAPPPEEA
jgi:hypothetical protein